MEEKQRAKCHRREEAAAQAAKAATEGNHEEATRLEHASTYTPLWRLDILLIDVHMIWNNLQHSSLTCNKLRHGLVVFN